MLCPCRCESSGVIYGLLEYVLQPRSGLPKYARSCNTDEVRDTTYYKSPWKNSSAADR